MCEIGVLELHLTVPCVSLLLCKCGIVVHDGATIIVRGFQESGVPTEFTAIELLLELILEMRKSRNAPELDASQI